MAAGVALDALELGTTIDADLRDADRQLGKKRFPQRPALAEAGRAPRWRQKVAQCWELLQEQHSFLLLGQQ